jgi:hypothetical protein
MWTWKKNINNYAKQNQSLFRTKFMRVPGSWGSQTSIESAHEDGEVVYPSHRLHIPPRKYPWYLFLLKGWVEARAKYQCQIPKSPSEIETTIFRLVAPCLNQTHSSKHLRSNITLQKQARRWRLILSHNAVLHCDIKYSTPEKSTNLMNIETHCYCHNKYLFYFLIIRFTISFKQK